MDKSSIEKLDWLCKKKKASSRSEMVRMLIKEAK
ncbi:ribbon-helix-helix protein, CopG family [Faecalicoccus pleomorphus]|nr:ribbon-helix-helix protein, CopG family [Faecalicoccus pleomorphus]